MKKKLLNEISNIYKIIMQLDKQEIEIIYERLNQKNETYVIEYYKKLIERI